MPKKLTYRKPRNGVAEQYGINLSKKMLNDMGVFPDNREVQVEYDREKKIIKIRKKDNDLWMLFYSKIFLFFILVFELLSRLAFGESA